MHAKNKFVSASRAVARRENARMINRGHLLSSLTGLLDGLDFSPTDKFRRRDVLARLDPAGSLDQITRVNIREIKKRLTGGFRPFAIRTTDGQEFSIPHPEFVLVGKYTIAVVDKDGFINNLDPLHIVSARDMSRRNGHS